MKLWGLFLLILLPAGLFAQTLSGVVIDRYTKQPVDYATVATTYTSSYTSQTGSFSLLVHKGDTIRVTCMGYRPFKAAYTPGRDTMTIYLQQLSIMLKGVSVKAIHDRHLDSLRTRKEFSSTFNYHDPTYKDMFVNINPYAYIPNNYINATNSTASIVSVDLLSVARLLSKNKDQSSKLQKTLLKDEENNYVDRVFSKQKVTGITNMHGDSLRDFMVEYQPSVPELKKMTDYELLLYIKKSYAEFIKSYVNEKQTSLGK